MAKLPIWTPLASLLLALAWLLPNASPPWPSFHKDAWSAFVFCLVAVVVILRRSKGIARVFFLDALSVTLLLLALIPWLQLSLGIVHFSGHAALGFGYFFAAGMTCLIGNAWERSDPGKPGDFLFLALLLAALGTSWMMLAQWLRVDVNEVWVNPLPVGGRPSGNLVQPNNAATLLVLGMVSLFWFAVRGRLSKAVFVTGSTYLLFLVVLTGSRSGYLSFLVVTLLIIFMGLRRNEFRPWRGASCLLLGLFPLFVFMITREWGAESGLGQELGQQPFERNLTSARLLVYRAYLDATWAKPWLGYGFEQGAKTQLASAALGHQLPGLFTWAHNAFLDLATWFGIPLALLAIAAVASSVMKFLRSPFDMNRAVYFAGICVVFLHGMVELPLAYAYFLLPVSLMAGAMLSGLKGVAVPVPRSLVAAGVVGLGAMLGVLTQDYLRVESAFNIWRFKQANVGTNHPIDIPDTLLLNNFKALLVGLRGTANSMTEDSLRDFEQAVLLDPSGAAMQQLAELQLSRGDTAGAQGTADMGRLLTQGNERKQLAARWRYLGTQDPAFRAVEWGE